MFLETLRSCYSPNPRHLPPDNLWLYSNSCKCLVKIETHRGKLSTSFYFIEMQVFFPSKFSSDWFISQDEREVGDGSEGCVKSVITLARLARDEF